jgi:polysaccharide export outer membrane protein
MISAEGLIGWARPRSVPTASVSLRGPGSNKNRILLFFSLVCLAGCSEAPPPNPVLTPPSGQQAAADADLYSPELEGEYQIGVGDTLLIQSYYEPNLRQTALVGPDGRISLILLGSMDVVGKTASALTAELTRDYAEHLDHTDITVAVSQIANSTVYVSGEVKTPAMQPISGPETVLQAITTSGGFLTSANQKQVIIMRRKPDGSMLAFVENATDVLNNKAGDIYLKRHDIVYVPKTPIAKADEFVDQYINQIIPRSILMNLGYTFLNPVGRTTTVLVPP